ncbi:MAG TPA: hypothetical protein VJK49_07770 [Candidatus Limnocylindrales bacterium]|nr:hypothetical protein [Candidatus Limnocylindrales bacterium]
MGSPVFDVPAWVATLAECAREEIVFDGQSENDGYLTTRYLRAGRLLATVDLVGLPMAHGRRANWQLFAQVGKQVGRAQLPASTRFAWH